MNTILPAIVSFDQNSIRSITHLQNSLLDPVMIIFTRMWDSWMIWIWITIVLLLLKKYRYKGKVIGSWLIINTLIGEWVLKHVFERERPFLQLPEIILKIPAPITTSFPSWHTSISWCFAVLFTYYFWTRSKLLVVAVWGIAIGIMVSRLYL